MTTAAIMKIPKGMNSPLSSNQIIPSHNPIQLAAISNYKLAQLTFAPPDLHSLRKTANIKNMIEDVYSSTPAEWLQQMTRWQYFTPESLEEMTQEGLEEIFAQYAQTIEAFRPIKSVHYNGEDLFDEDDDGQEGGDDLWIAEEEDQLTTSIPPTLPSHHEAEDEGKKSKTNSVESTSSSIFSQPNLTISNELVDAKSKLLDKPLPAIITSSNEEKQVKRKSGFNMMMTNSNTSTNNKKLNRLSWTSDTGITSSIVSQNLANEIMSLFDMDFAIDIKVDTAPKLPELPFKPSTNKRRSQRRQSQDMLSTLIPAFEKIALENSVERYELKKQLFPSAPVPTPLIIKSVPTRSSSLRHRQELVSPVSPQTPPPTPPSHSTKEKTIPKKKSILRLASLMTPNHHDKKSSKHDLVQPPLPAVEEKEIINTPRKTSTSTVDSTATTATTTSSSSWSFVSEGGERQQATVKVISSAPTKPLPEPPAVAAVEKISRRTTSKKKRRSVMEKTMSKRKSNHGLTSIYDASSSTSAIEETVKQQAPPPLSRSKSAFIKIGNGLKTKKQLKQIRRTSSAKNFTETDYNAYKQQEERSTNIYSEQQQQEAAANTEETIASITVSANSFVKRMTSFNWRIKPKNKPVVV